MTVIYSMSDVSVLYSSALQPVCTMHPRVHQNMRGVHH